MDLLGNVILQPLTVDTQQRIHKHGIEGIAKDDNCTVAFNLPYFSLLIFNRREGVTNCNEADNVLAIALSYQTLSSIFWKTTPTFYFLIRKTSVQIVPLFSTSLSFFHDD